MMDRLKSWLGKTEVKAIDDPWLLLAGGVATAAGVNVGITAAMRCPTVYACVRIIAEAVAQMPLHLFALGDNGARDRATDHPLYGILRWHANDWTSSTEFRTEMMFDLLTHGMAAAFINRDSAGEVVELIRIPADKIRVDQPDAMGPPIFHVTQTGGSEVSYDHDQIFYLRHLAAFPLSSRRVKP